MITDKQFLRYQRQISLPEIGEQGQERLLNSHVLIIGCGGLGSAVVLYLASAGVGKLVLVDDDTLETSNLPRQVIYRQQQIGELKANAAKMQIEQINSECSVRAICKRLDAVQLDLEVMLADVVIDCSDNLVTKQSINRACFGQSTPLITASAVGWEGQLAVFDFPNEKACYRCLYPFDELAQSTRCSELGVVGPVVGTMGNMQALAAIQKLAMGQFLMPTSQLTRFDGKTLIWQQLTISRDRECTTCSPKHLVRSTDEGTN